ncbi:MAG: pilus assembly protein PilM [Candidatus Omnitrophota bacterium]
MTLQEKVRARISKELISLRQKGAAMRRRTGPAGDLVGIYLTGEKVSAVSISRPPAFTIKDQIEIPLTPPLDDERLAAALEQAFAEKRLPRSGAWLAIDLPQEDLIFARLSLPSIPASELDGAIRWNLKERVALDVHEAQLNYYVIGESVKADGTKNLELMAVLAKKSRIDRLIAVFKKCGIELSGICVTPFALAHLVAADGGVADDGDPLLICHVGDRQSYIGVSIKGRIGFVRQLPLSALNLREALTGGYLTRRGRITLSAVDAEKILSEFGIPAESEEPLYQEITASQIAAMARPVVERLCEDLQRSIEYYQREFSVGKIDRLLLTGEGVRIKGLDRLIAAHLNVTILRLKPFEGPFGAMIAAGAALSAVTDGGEPFTLLPREIRQRQANETTMLLVKIFTGAALFFCAILFFIVTLQTADCRKQLSSARAQRVLLNDLKEMEDRTRARQGFVESIKSKEIYCYLLLKELAAVTPGTIVFTDIEFDQVQKSLSLRGKVAVNPSAVHRLLSTYMETLEKTTLFKEANLTGVQREGTPQNPVSGFSITCVAE